eukprot:CAMPEP_0197825712 /NCGR_PEP_ID=MMETSP1437-20131217/2750_1 /TAXON_ID=49252 ORGANISM="Eucampia antarctica, Strain CCMP1452" /NCGR_SAMPLE_ID=MMETSP1437 /ASSEMBLY_ACC=CAM_ASM_001096 /LENGTH=141 /DNA_ID=CAMNT_0043425831 /DNA_START=49 /DNA_END=470 /DNA_ORIENTATION=-
MKDILFSISSCFIIGLFSFLPVIGGTTTEFERWVRPNNKDNNNSADDLQYGQIQEQELSRILSGDGGFEVMRIVVITGFVLFFVLILIAFCRQIGGNGGNGGAGARRAGARRAGGGGTGVVYGDGGVGFVGGGGDYCGGGG